MGLVGKSLTVKEAWGAELGCILAWEQMSWTWMAMPRNERSSVCSRGQWHPFGWCLVGQASKPERRIRTSALARGLFFWGGCLVSSWGTRRETPLTRRTSPLESLQVEGLANTEFQLHEASGTECPVIFCFRKRKKNTPP